MGVLPYNAQGGKLGVNISIYKYEDLDPNYVKKLDMNVALQPSSQQLVVLSPNQSVTVPYYRIIDPTSLDHMTTMKAEQRCPDALKALNLLKNVFKNGMPLPS